MAEGSYSRSLVRADRGRAGRILLDHVANDFIFTRTGLCWERTAPEDRSDSAASGSPVSETTRGGAVVARRAHNPKVSGSNPLPATVHLDNRRVVRSTAACRPARDVHA